MKKRILSIMLVVCVLSTLLTVTVFAMAPIEKPERLNLSDSVSGLSTGNNICCEKASFKVVPPEGYEYEIETTPLSDSELGDKSKELLCTIEEDGTYTYTIVKDSSNTVEDFNITITFYGEDEQKAITYPIKIVNHTDNDNDHYCEYCETMLSEHNCQKKTTLDSGMICGSCSVCDKKFSFKSSDENTDSAVSFKSSDFGDWKTANEIIAETISKDAHTDVIIDMDDETVVPGSVFETVAGNDVTLYIDTEQVLCQIETSSFTANTFTNIDFDVKTGKNTTDIPVSLIREFGGEDDTMEYSVAHNGELGFTATMYLRLTKSIAVKNVMSITTTPLT